jgi:hypothetical protein
MNLIDEWKTTLKRAWSIRFALAATVFSSLEVALPNLQGIIPAHTFGYLATFTAVGAAVARLLNQQPKEKPDDQ